MDAYEFCSTVNDLLIPRALLQFVKNSQDGEEQQDLLKAIASNEKCVRLSPASNLTPERLPALQPWIRSRTLKLMGTTQLPPPCPLILSAPELNKPTPRPPFCF